MTANELRAALRDFDHGRMSRDDPLYRKMWRFAPWWYDGHLTEEQRKGLRRNGNSCWEDMAAGVPDEELMFLWACF